MVRVRRSRACSLTLGFGASSQRMVTVTAPGLVIQVNSTGFRSIQVNSTKMKIKKRVKTYVSR
jgi:hypothetical protein